MGRFPLDPTKPWILRTLAYYNLSSALQDGYITLKQLNALTEDQVYSLRDAGKGKELQAKVIELVNANTIPTDKPSLKI